MFGKEDYEDKKLDHKLTGKREASAAPQSQASLPCYTLLTKRTVMDVRLAPHERTEAMEASTENSETTA